MATKPKTATTLKPYAYNGFILRRNADGTTDVINPATRQWATFPTQRYARWAATFTHNLSARFDAHQPLKTLPKVEV